MEPVNLSNTSTPDLTELINLVKPGTQNQSQFSKTTNMDAGVSSTDTGQGQFSVHIGDHPSVSNIGNLGSEIVDRRETPLPEVHGIQIQASDASSIFNTGLLPGDDGCEGSQSYTTVMALQMPNSLGRLSVNLIFFFF